MLSGTDCTQQHAKAYSTANEPAAPGAHLLLFLFLIITGAITIRFRQSLKGKCDCEANSRNVVEAELVRVLCRRDDADPVPERVLLEELLGKVLDVPLGKRDVRCHGDLRVACASA